MATFFEVFVREHILTGSHFRNPYSFEVQGKGRKLMYERKAAAIVCGFISAGLAAGASYVLDRSRTTILLSAAGTALTTFYAVTGYFKWRIMQSPVERPLVKESDISTKSMSRPDRQTGITTPKGEASDSSVKSTTIPVRNPGIEFPGSSHTFEDFKQKPNWLIPQQSSDSTFVDKATNLRREMERKYFASLWKSMYEGFFVAGEHYVEYFDQDAQLRTNKFSVEQGA